jgi:hypothetical protein
MTMRDKTRLALAIMLVLAITPAYAGPLTGALNYIQGNLVTDIETLAVIGIGVVLFAMHVNWWLVIGICAGIWIIANPQTIVSAFSAG